MVRYWTEKWHVHPVWAPVHTVPVEVVHGTLSQHWELVVHC
jgi:hypothetical protein